MRSKVMFVGTRRNETHSRRADDKRKRRSRGHVEMAEDASGIAKDVYDQGLERHASRRVRQ